jgi:adenine/guanine phosphoribosyltransferase-like PRPP-binding protein
MTTNTIHRKTGILTGAAGGLAPAMPVATAVLTPVSAVNAVWTPPPPETLTHN